MDEQSMDEQSTDEHASVVGLVLAAGEGSRLGGPKALVAGDDGVPWLARAAGVLAVGGAAPVYAVVGADADAVRDAAPPGVRTIEATDWREGMGASLRAGLGALATRQPEAAAVVVLLVDTPGVGAEVVARLVGRAAPEVLVRATYDGRPGHPVVIGRDHWAGVITSASGDRGARDYLLDHGVVDVECADIADGSDIDTPEALAGWLRGDQPG
jgi:CTP:molybdopterin cytidylyltransferase MocA